MAINKVLIAEDESVVRKIFARYLSSKGYDILEAENGVEALNFFEKYKPDIIISDIDMPLMKGTELIKIVKGLNPAIISIIITGHGTLETAIEMLGTGCDEFLLKPLTNLSMLDAAIERCISRRNIFINYQLISSISSQKSLIVKEIGETMSQPVSEIVATIKPLVNSLNEKNIEEAQLLLHHIKEQSECLEKILQQLHTITNKI